MVLQYVLSDRRLYSIFWGMQVLEREKKNSGKMLPQRLKKAVTDNPKKVADLIDLVNLPTILRDFMGQSQSSQLNCFKRVWSYIKENNLQVRSQIPPTIHPQHAHSQLYTLLCMVFAFG